MIQQKVVHHVNLHSEESTRFLLYMKNQVNSMMRSENNGKGHGGCEPCEERFQGKMSWLTPRRSRRTGRRAWGRRQQGLGSAKAGPVVGLQQKKFQLISQSLPSPNIQYAARSKFTGYLGGRELPHWLRPSKILLEFQSQFSTELELDRRPLQLTMTAPNC
jgi:hypothetical protein